VVKNVSSFIHKYPIASWCGLFLSLVLLCLCTYSCCTDIGLHEDKRELQSIETKQREVGKDIDRAREATERGEDAIRKSDERIRDVQRGIDESKDIQRDSRRLIEETESIFEKIEGENGWSRGG
jgi:septal ring factor EnvC (AmiA/AmiB activator)